MNIYNQPNENSVKIDATVIAAIRAEVEKMNELLATDEATAETLFQMNRQIHFISQLNGLYLQHAMGGMPIAGFGPYGMNPMQYGPYGSPYPQAQQGYNPAQPMRGASVMRQDPDKRPAKTIRFKDGLSILPMGVGENTVTFILFNHDQVIAEINSTTLTISVAAGISDLEVINNYLNQWYTYLIVDGNHVEFEALEDNRNWAQLYDHLKYKMDKASQQWIVNGPDVPPNTTITIDA